MTYLLDVSLLLVLHHPLHPHYKAVERWFAERAGSRFATCPITQSGLVRLLTRGTPDFDPFEMQDAHRTLQLLLQRPGHQFWQDVPDYLSATKALKVRMQGHRQTTDAYLLGLAIHNRGKLATLDRGIVHLAGPEFKSNVELVEPRTRSRVN
jgi:uncharacterized protein